MKTGISSIDDLLKPGLPMGELTVFAGSFSGGRSTFGDGAKVRPVSDFIGQDFRSGIGLMLMRKHFENGGTVLFPCWEGPVPGEPGYEALEKRLTWLVKN